MLSTHSCRDCSLAVLVCSKSSLRAWGSVLSRSLSGAVVVREHDARQKPCLHISMCLNLSKHYRGKNIYISPLAVVKLRVIYTFITDDTVAEIG